MTNCTPPYCMGSSPQDCAGCNCNCCPPDPCYTSWKYVYKCGTTQSDWDTGSGQPASSGCDCTITPFIAPNLGVEFPTFDDPYSFTFNVEDELQALFIQGCSIPCQTVTVKITTTGCCFYKNTTSDTTFITVGAGTVSAEITNGTGICHGSFKVLLNDTPNFVEVTDCETLTIKVLLPSGGACCQCCQISSKGVLLGGASYKQLSYYRKRNPDGSSKILMNPAVIRDKLIKRMNRGT